MSAVAKNPFKPGFGRYPPVLAGREAEQSRLHAGLDTLQALEAPNATLLSAPRGMGKTVLLDWLLDQAEGAGRRVNVAAEEISTLEDMLSHLAPDLLETTEVTRAAGVNLGVVRGEVSRARRQVATLFPLRKALHDALLAQCRQAPLLVAVDEAHDLEPEVASLLLNVAQKLVRARLPFWLVLAGAPGLETHLRSAGVSATFIERADKLYPRLLDVAASRDALAGPLQTQDWQLDAAALDEIVTDAQGYPYFLQLWGEALWAAGTVVKRLDRNIIRQAREPVRKERDAFYVKRYRELRRFPCPALPRAAEVITKAACSVSELFQKQQAARLNTIYSAISQHLPASMDPDAAFDYLERRGFIWNPGGDLYVPGIPSLVDFLLQQSTPDPALEEE